MLDNPATDKKKTCVNRHVDLPTNTIERTCNNEEVLGRIETTRKQILEIKKEQLKRLGHMSKYGLENLTHSGYISDKINRNNQGVTYLSMSV